MYLHYVGSANKINKNKLIEYNVSKHTRRDLIGGGVEVLLREEISIRGNDN